MLGKLEALIKEIEERKDLEILQAHSKAQEKELEEIRSQITHLQTQLILQSKLNKKENTNLLDLTHQSKLAEQEFSNISDERFQQTKTLIKLEEEIFLLQDEIKKKNEEIKEKDKLFEEGFLPNKDSLFLEVVKGFGVEFVEKDTKTVLIKNKKKMDVESISLNGNLEEIKERIWELI